MKTIHNASDYRPNVDEHPRPALDGLVVRHLTQDDGWRQGAAPQAVVRGLGHPSHVTIGGWPFRFVGAIVDGSDAGNALYESY